MSDEEEEWMTPSEDDGDFSASEDEWVPESTTNKKGKKSQEETMESDESETSDDEVESDIETEEESDPDTPKNLTRKQAAKRGGASQKSSGNSSQGVRKLFFKYKPAPLQSAGSSSGTVSTSLSDLLKRSEFRSKKLNSSQSDSQVSSSTNSQPIDHHKKTPEIDDDDSSSSGDEHLVPADQINLNSEFFNVQSSSKSEEAPPDFDCNAGLAKEDDSSSEPDFDGFSNESIHRDSSQATINKKKTPKIVAQINEGSSKIVDLQELHRFNQNLEDAKKQLKGFQSKSFGNKEDVNVSQLLAMGEETAVTSTSSQRSGAAKQSKGSKRKHEESGSDWEDVEGKAKKLKQNNLLSYFKKKTPT